MVLFMDKKRVFMGLEFSKQNKKHFFVFNLQIHFISTLPNLVS